MDLNKHVVTNDTNKPFHSNGYAQVAVGNRVGATSAESFNQRQQIERNRRLIYGYNRSAIGNAYGALRAKPVSVSNGITRVVAPSLQQYNSNSLQRPNSPPPQHYNPFA